MSFEKLTIKAVPWKVQDLIRTKREGGIHLPDLQRGFVWTAERVKALFDSLYRKYPVGALLLWKPTWESQNPPFITRPWDLFVANSAGKGDPEPHPSVEPGAIFVLDGQQRLTSLFRVVFQSKAFGRESLDPDLYVSLSPEEEWIDDPFHLRSRSLKKRERDGLLVRAGILFAGARGEESESAVVRSAIKQWVSPDDDLFFKAMDRANTIRNSILNSEIIAYEIDASAESDSVIEIFVRLNQQGVRLRPSDLATARLTGQMSNFRETAKATLGAPYFEGFSAESSGGTSRSMPLDTDLFVRTALFLGSGAIRYREAEKRRSVHKSTRETAYKSIENNWDLTSNSLRRAVSLIRSAGIRNGSWLPYRYVLLPPAVAFANGHDLGDDFWIGWLLAVSIWGHYAGSAETTAQNDAKLAREGNKEKLLESIRARAKRSDTLIPEVEEISGSIVNTKGLHLGLLVHLARNRGRSFPGGKLFASTHEPIEIHHIFPKATLNKSTRDSASSPDRNGNLTPIFADDNRSLGDTPPSDYLRSSKPDDLDAHGIPKSPELWALERYQDFCYAREQNLTKIISDLLQTLGIA